MDMTLSDVRSHLEAEGYGLVITAKIHYMIQAGYVERPPQDGSRNFVFAEQHLAQIKAYLDDPPKCGPKPKKATSSPMSLESLEWM